METIRLSTWIDAPIERCFLLSLSIDLHVASTRSTPEDAIAGATAGLIGEGGTMTFQGRHLGTWRSHTNLIETMRPHSYYRDVMIAGSFRHFEHEHHFAPMDDGTRMRDEIRFSTHWGGALGRLATRMFVRKRLKAMLSERSAMIKRVAESEEWRKYLESWVERRPVAPVKSEPPNRRSGNTLLRGPHGIAATPPRG